MQQAGLPIRKELVLTVQYFEFAGGFSAMQTLGASIPYTPQPHLML